LRGDHLKIAIIVGQKKGTQTLTKNRLIIGCHIEKSKHTTLTSVKSTTICTCCFVSECQCLLKGDHLKISVVFGQKKGTLALTKNHLVFSCGGDKPIKCIRKRTKRAIRDLLGS